MAFVTPPKDELIATLLDLEQPLPARMRSIFYLRTVGGSDAIEALCKGASRFGGGVLSGLDSDDGFRVHARASGGAARISACATRISLAE
jgi:hypothetical protein